VVKGPSGRIWFSLHGGVSVIDPSRLFRESVPAVIHIETITADGSPVIIGVSPQVPAGRRRVTFGFVGLSLSAPERVRFRYRLEAFDKDWSEPSASNQAVYTNLGPGSYRLRVIASNGEGLWNSGETSIPVEVLPLFWQTWWFRVAAVLSVAVAFIGVHRLRLRQVTNQLNVRFEERLAERTRIAQELHDTLLQGLLGASMQLHAAAKGVPTELPARQKLNAVSELVRRVADEGRNAVRGLRTACDNDNLEDAFARVPERQFAPSSMDFHVLVVGQPRLLNESVRDEIYRIGREALANSFRHSRASRVELRIEYAAAVLRLQVRDNGCGIDSEVLSAGRDGHFGLVGMRERAAQIDSHLRVLSCDGQGTEVELTVPAKVAFRLDPTTYARTFFWQRVLRIPSQK
jgi:signal transduction histidine kinase